MDSSKPSFLFEQTDLCFSLWRFVCHTNWLCLPLAVTVFSRERPRLNLPLGNSALANTFRKKCTYCYWKAADTILWRSFVQSLSFPLLFLSPTEIHSSKFSPPNTHIHREHNKRLIFWKDSVCPVILLRADKTGTEKKSQIEVKQREDRERKEGIGRRRKKGGESVPSGLVASPPAGFGGRYGWSLTLWQGPARRWPAPHSESIWTQTPSPRLFLAPCPRTCNTEKQTNKSAHGVEKQEGKKKNLLKESARRLVFIMLSCCVFNVIFTSLEIVTVTLDYFTTSNKKSHIWSGWGINRTSVKSLVRGLLFCVPSWCFSFKTLFHI